MSKLADKVTISLDPYSILTAIGIILILYVLWQVRFVIFIFFISIIIASTLKPLVNNFEHSFKIPRSVSVGVIFVLVFSFLTSLGILVVRDITDELSNLPNVAYRIEEIVPGNQKDFVDQMILELEGGNDVVFRDLRFKYNGDEILLEEVPVQSNTGVLSFQSITSGTEILIELFNNTVGIAIGVFTIMIVSFYMLHRKDNVYDGLLKLIPTDKRSLLRTYIHKIEEKLGAWLLAQFMLMLIIGIMTYVGLILPQLFLSTDIYSIGKFAVTIAVLAGILEIIPNLGPLITWIFASVISIATATAGNIWGQLLYVTLLFAIIQQLENMIIVPKIIKETVGIDPIVTILSIIAATTLFGLTAAVLIIPFIASVQIAVEFFMRERKSQNKDISSKTSLAI